MKKYFSYLLIAIAFSLCSTSSLALVCAQPDKTQTSSLGDSCSEDPACVIVGDTHMLEWKSEKPQKIVVVCMHGLGLCAKAYKPIGRQFADCGIDGFAVNVRGFGPDRDQPARAQLDCIKTVEDVRTFLARLRSQRPDWRIVLVGESMGGALAIRIASQYPELIDGVICSAPAWKLHHMKQTAVKGVFELTFFRRSRPGPAGRAVMRQATSNVRLTEHWVADQSHKLKLSLSEARAFLAFISKTKTYARKLNVPVLVVQGLNDRLVSAKAVCVLYRSIACSNKMLVIDCKGEHLVLEEGQSSKALVEKLVEWIVTDSLAESMRKTCTLNCQKISRDEQKRLRKLLRISSVN